MKQEIFSLEQLKATLELERVALNLHTPVLAEQPVDFEKLEEIGNTLNDIATIKHRLAAQLDALRTGRERSFEKSGLDPASDDPAWPTANAPQLAQAWRKLHQLAQDTHELNQHNGAIQQAYIRYAQQALHALAGQDATQ